MAIITQASRVKHHTSSTSGAFTVPASEDFTDGSWDKWDLAKSEIGVNEADDTAFLRIDGNLRQIYPQTTSERNWATDDLTFVANRAQDTGGFALTVSTDAGALAEAWYFLDSTKNEYGFANTWDKYLSTTKLSYANNVKVKTLAADGEVSHNVTAPSASVANAHIAYSQDVVAGQAAPHFRLEDNSIVKLYPEAAVTTAQGIATALTAQGLLDASTIAAASGIWGITDSAGAFTYYADIAAANAAASSGDTIELFADVNETGTTEWVLKDGVNINLNGYTYEMSNAGTNNAVTDNALAVTCTIFNGIIKRSGGTDSDANSIGLHIDSTTSDVTLSGVTVNNTFGVATRIDGILRGGRHIGFTKGVYAGLITGELYDAYCYGGNDNGIFTYGIVYNCIIESNTGVGGRLLSLSVVHNTSFYSASSYGANTGGCSMFNCSSRSDGNHGLYANTSNNTFENCSFYSTSADGFHMTGSTTCVILNCSGMSTASEGMTFVSSTGMRIQNCAGYSTASYGLYFSDAGDDEALMNCTAQSTAASGMFCNSGNLYNCTVKSLYNNATGHGIYSNGVTQALNIFGCIVEVTHASANCITCTGSHTTYYGQNTFIGATTSVNANVTQGQTNASDSYGNTESGTGEANPNELINIIDTSLTPLTTGLAKYTRYAQHDMTITDVFAALTVQGTVSGVTTFDININGVTALSTKLTIDFGEDTSLTAATPAVISVTSISKGDKITIDIDVVSGGAVEAAPQIVINAIRV